MAKKTAKSKGYRKANAKKPYLSKKDIVILCVLLAVVAVGAILLFSYDDGALKVSDGKIVDAGENWLIVNGNTRGGRRYFKLGEVGDIPGYTMEAEPFQTDDNLTQFNYSPEDAESAVTGITLSASAYTPAQLAAGNSRMVSSISGIAVSEVTEGSIGDVAYTYYTYTHEYHADEDEDAEDVQDDEETTAENAPEADENPSDAQADDEPNRFEQAMNAYVSAPRNGSVVVSITAKADSAEDYLTEEQLKEVLSQAVAAVTLESDK